MDSGIRRTKFVNTSHMNGEETERATPEPANQTYVAGSLKGENFMNAEEVASTDGIRNLRNVMEVSETEGKRAYICRKGRPPIHDEKVSVPPEGFPESALQPEEIVDASVTTDSFESKLHYLSDVSSGIETVGQSFPGSDSTIEKIESQAGNAENGDSSTRDGMTLPDGDSITLSERGECESAENALESTEEDDKEEEETEWPSEVFHMYMLGKICRICAEMTVVFDGPRKGVPKLEMVRHVKKIWKVDLSDEDSNRYPVNVCVHCERKIKRLYLKVSKKKKCEMFRTEPASFEPHRDQDCPVCMLRDADVEAQTQSKAEEKEKKSPDDNAEAKAASEPRRNPARKRGWPDQEPPYRSVGCQTGWETFQDVATGLEEHDYTQDDTLDQYLMLPKKLSGRTPYHKQPLCAVNTKYIRQGRLKPLISHIDRYCQSHKENKVEAMFFLLMQALRDVGDRSRENAIVDIWTRKGSMGTSLTGEECLAKRILLKQTKDQYRKEYRYYKEKLDKPVLKPPLIVDRLEKTYFPEHLEYYITDGETGPVIYQHEKQNDPSYFALHESVESNKVDGVMGVRWRYFDAVAKTLEELVYTMDPFVHELNENACIQVDLSDYCEEKKDMTYLTDKNDASLDSKRQQGKMITYLFCIQSLQAITEQTVKWMPSEDVSICRPLMKALVTDGSALRSSLLMIEEERNKMAGKYFHVTSQNGTPLRFVVFFSNDAPEVRRDYRNLTGLSMSSFKKAPTVISRYGNLCQELKRSWLASSPRLSHVGRVTNSRTRCRRCGEHGHNVRKCSKPSLDNMDGSKVVQHKRQKKLRAVPVDAYTVSSSNMGLVPAGAQPQHIPQEQSLQQLKQEQQESLVQMTSVPANITQNNSAIRSEDQLLWACPGITNAPQNSTHQSQNTQVLIPCSSSEFQSMPHRTLIQGSQGASPPVYVWTYAVVQPQTGSVVQQQQQPVSHQLSSIHQQPAPATATADDSHSSAAAAGQQQLQPLSVIHQQALSVGREHEPRGPSHDVQQLGIIHQTNNGLQAVEASQQQLTTMGHQSASAQQQQMSPFAPSAASS
ncbi:uncharacterized protein LOC135204646, partial [Macrobrachium nipponense]|uniref:uncharacterized protein LOC135204646 n=1 Tax=Macrobrachium nipponense TaxID=159736 RepID=UPI0030C86034